MKMTPSPATRPAEKRHSDGLTVDAHACESSATSSDGDGASEMSLTVQFSQLESPAASETDGGEPEAETVPPEWREGTRVRTRCALMEAAVKSRVTHPAGSEGRVWAVRDDGVILVALDTEDCMPVFVLAEPSDLEVTLALIPNRTRVRIPTMTVLSVHGETVVNHERVGIVMGYLAASNEYEVGFSTLRVRFTVAARKVQLATAQRSKFLAKVVGLLGRRGGAGGAGGLGACGASALENLHKSPTYSNIRNSPRGTFRRLALENAVGSC